MDIHIKSFIIQLLAIFLSFTEVIADDLARGWNSNINWMTLQEGLTVSKEQQKPLMLLIHKSWCGACKNLKPRFAGDKEIEELSKDFVMVNALDEEEPTDKKYSPDGGYIPRILFLDTNGDVDTEIFNQNGNPNYKYFYPEPTAIVNTMKLAREKLASNSRTTDEL